MKTLCLVITLVLLNGCASAPPPDVESLPTWVSNPEKDYPSQRYLVSVGTGASREDAIRDAKRQMAESFLIKVQSVTRVSAESKLTQNTSGNLSGDSGEIVSKEMSYETNSRLRGAEIKSVSEQKRETYALLVLDKLNARSGLLMEANRIQSKILSNLDSLESQFNGMKFREVETDVGALRELSLEASVLGMGALLKLDAIEARLQSLGAAHRQKNSKKAFLVKALKGDERFSRDLESCLQDQGATVYTGDALGISAERIELSVIEHPEHLQVEGWVKNRYEVTANIISPDGRSYRISESRTETARSKEAGLEAAASEISSKICEQTWNRVSEMK